MMTIVREMIKMSLFMSDAGEKLVWRSAHSWPPTFMHHCLYSLENLFVLQAFSFSFDVILWKQIDCFVIRCGYDFNWPPAKTL